MKGLSLHVFPLLALGSSIDGFGYIEPPQEASITCGDETSFIQISQPRTEIDMIMKNGLALTGLRGQPPEEEALKDWQKSVDANGRECSLCGEPSAERSDRDYKKRDDCGNQTLSEHPENYFVPLITFSRPANGTDPGTNAWCELNSQKICADSLYNEDYLFQAKSVYEPPDYDWYYCRANGWLKPEIVALQHDFDGMTRESQKQCDTKYAKYGWNTSLTISDMALHYAPGLARGYPTQEEALFIGAWTCAMGSSGCDMAYCAYSFCDLGDGVPRTYDECEGWDPVKGMPAPSVGAA